MLLPVNLRLLGHLDICRYLMDYADDQLASGVKARLRSRLVYVVEIYVSITY